MHEKYIQGYSADLFKYLLWKANPILHLIAQ